MLLGGEGEVAIGTGEGVDEGGKDEEPVVSAGGDVHRVFDVARAESLDEVHIGFEGEVVVADTNNPIDKLQLADDI